MGTTLAFCGAVAGWGVMVLIARRRVATLQLRCDEAEAENARWRQAHSGRLREPADGPGGWERGGWEVGREVRDATTGAATTAGPTTGATATGAPAGTAPAPATGGPAPVTAVSPGPGPDFTERAFANIGRRVQAIVHRQLSDLGEMQERHGGDPAVFADLMRLDHATALIGRFADSLVVLAGERPGRQWSEPVPVFSVLRGAMSRIVDYRRVELAAAPEVELAGTAVEAIVHALAELLDNATRYSPPDSRVILTARRTPDGVVIEVVDAGVGMAPQAAEHVARVLADPGAPGLDLADVGGSPRLGLAVIGRLAHTIGFQATVRPSAAGGVKAQLVLPKELVLEHAGSVPADGEPVGGATAGTVAESAAGYSGGSGGSGPAAPPGTRGPRAHDAGPRANGTYDGRPGGLPQRRRRPPTVTPGAAAAVASNVADRANGTSVPGPGQWLDAFRGDKREAGHPEADRSDRSDHADHADRSDHSDRNDDGQRGAAS